MSGGIWDSVPGVDEPWGFHTSVPDSNIECVSETFPCPEEDAQPSEPESKVIDVRQDTHPSTDAKYSSTPKTPSPQVSVIKYVSDLSRLDSAGHGCPSTYSGSSYV